MVITSRAVSAPRLRGLFALPLLAALTACQAPEVGLSEASASQPPPSDAPPPAPASSTSGPGAAADEPEVPAPVEAREPIGYRSTRSAAVVYAEPSRRAKRRGRVEARRPFAIYSVEPGPGCDGEGWAAVDQGGYVCLEGASVSKGPARIQPELADGQIVPFIYARPKILDRKTGAIATVPRYRDRYALIRGDEPLDVLQPDRQYTFVKTKTRKAGLMLIDAEERAVLARDLKIAAPSEFSGRELAAAPVPPGRRPAWSVSRPAVLRERPHPSARPVQEVEYHATLDIDPQ